MSVLGQLIFLPILSGLLLMLIPRRFERVLFPLGCFVAAYVFALSVWLYLEFVPAVNDFQFVENIPWIKSFNITYYVGVDGISLLMILLTTLLTLVSIFYSAYTIKFRQKEFVVAILALETAMIGTFSALDVFLFYVFWEVMLVPMYLLIGIFGGPRRIYATLKFFLYTMAGSVFMLVALLIVYWMHQKQFGFYSTALPDLYRITFPIELQRWLFAAFLFAFAIKIPMFPFHTWLPDAHVEAPTAGSVLLAGVLLKMGGYGMIRLAFPLFPEATFEFAPFLGILAVIGMIYGAYCAFAQQDMKKLVAYSSVSHMGFVILGLASLSAIGFEGAVFQMIAHGISTGALFLLVGMLYERRHTRMIGDFGGVAKVSPRFAAVFLFVTLASIGLPGLCGFVGEFLVLGGSFHALVLKHPAWIVGFSLLSIILGATYMLSLYERLFWGEIKFEENKTIRDLRWYEGIALALPLLAALWLGIRPNDVLNYIQPATEQLAQTIHRQQFLATGDLR